MNRVRKIIHTDYAYKTGLSGKNVTVAIMDTGIVPHVDFGNRIRYFGDFCEGKTGLYDDNGHGTHVSGIVAGSGEASRKEYGMPVCHGIAPQADIVMLKVLDAKGNGNTRDVLAGMEWIAKNQQEYQIRLLNISVGMLPIVTIFLEIPGMVTEFSLGPLFPAAATTMIPLSQRSSTALRSSCCSRSPALGSIPTERASRGSGGLRRGTAATVRRHAVL